MLGAMTMEEWGVDPHRLIFANVQDAIENGGRAQNHARVVDLIRDGPSVLGVRYRSADGSLNEARARVTVNATGPWSPILGKLAGVPIDLRPAKGIHIVYDRRVSNFAIACDAVDGRGLLMVPHGNFTLAGTTDDDFYGDPDDIEVHPDEVDYILQAFDRIMPRSGSTGRSVPRRACGRRSFAGAATRTISRAATRSSTTRRMTHRPRQRHRGQALDVPADGRAGDRPRLRPAGHRRRLYDGHCPAARERGRG